MVYQYKKREDGSYECVECGVVKKNQNTMHYHMKSHEGKLPFECSHCKKQFLHKQTLENHVAAKHAEAQKSEFKCPFPECAFESMTKANCRIHFVRKHCEAFMPRGLTCSCGKECKSQSAIFYHAASCIKIPDAGLSDMLASIL